MKNQPAVKAFSLLELLIVIAVVVVLVGFLLPTTHNHGDTSRIRCINNLKHVGLGFRLYHTDGEPYPQYNPTNDVWQYFQVVGKEIGSPRVLICPKDTKIDSRTAAFDFETPAVLTTNNFAHPTRQNKDLSYFYSPEASEIKPGTILAGDRNISTNKTTMSGMLTVHTNTVQWTKGLHQESGNILLADGSAQQVSTAKLRQQFHVINLLYTNITQRLLIP